MMGKLSYVFGFEWNLEFYFQNWHTSSKSNEEEETQILSLLQKSKLFQKLMKQKWIS